MRNAAYRAAPPAVPVVYLLVPVSEREEFRPLPRGLVGWSRNRARRALDLWRWRTGGAPAPHFSTWQDAERTNRGDSAIRVASIALLRRAFGAPARIEVVGWDELAGLDPARVGAEAAVFVLGGGGYFGIHAGGRLAPRVGRDLAWLRRLRCPVVAFAPGVNRALEDVDRRDLDAAARATLGELAGRLGPIAVRDANTRRVLDSVAPGRARVLADPALFLAPAGPPAPRDDTVLTVGLNLAFHGEDASRALPARLRLVAAAARDLARRRPCRFVYFVHEQPERIVPALLRREGIVARVVDAAPAAMLADYAALDLHICQMLHSAILAFNAGVPTIAVAYDVKNAGLFDLMGLPEFCLSGDAPKLDAAIATALAGGPALRHRIAARKAVLRAETDAFLAAVVALTTEGAGRSVDS